MFVNVHSARKNEVSVPGGFSFILFVQNANHHATREP
jgi:hypothetical protein